MHRKSLLGKVLAVGVLAGAAAGCGDGGSECSCTLIGQENSVEISTTQSCEAYAEQNSSLYSSCFETAEASLMAPAWPLSLELRRSSEFPKQLVPGGGR